ncbi:MAG: alpha/beta hydrolase [Flavobacteriales bacterium]|nr:alpha/beta hydrolase [Flavobacteriales bacterium]MCB9449359.1 alpha/beta hydrolase [Flavobacteriales bacterium]
MEYKIQEEGEFKYVEVGQGHTIMLLHGLFGALSNFQDVIGHFADRYRVVIPLMPIYTLPVLETNVKNLAKYIHRFIKFRNYDQVTLLGNSLGGHVALIYAVTFGDRLHSMVLTGSSGLYEKAMGDTFPRREDYEYIKEKVAVTFYDPKHATKELVDECFSIVNDRGKLVRILSLAKSAIRHNMSKEVHKIEVPVCLIWGKNDHITPPEVAEDFHRLLPHSELHWIDQCCHAPMMEQPEQFNAILDDWLTRLFGGKIGG